MNKDLVGQTLLRQFRVDAFVESGGMAAVYRVWDLKRNVALAMKVLHADLADDPAVLKRFQREANALKKLTHPHIVPFYGMYQTPNFMFLLERFVDGFSLKEILRKQRGKSLSIKESLIYLKPLCASLGYAHANGLVHCDVKPGNVMIDLSGSIYLTDFGIARYSESTTTSLGTVGTPAYMAPEQIRGEAVSAVTDIYALGVLSFELLTGQRPFRGAESSTQRGGVTANERIRYGHLNVSPPDPRSINPELSEGIANVILRCLNKKPSDRFQSTQEFLRALCLAAGVTVEDLPDRVAPLERSISQQHKMEATKVGIEGLQPLTKIRKIPPRLLGGVLLGFLVVGGLGIWIVGRMFGGTGSEETILTEVPPQSQVTPVMSAATRTPFPTLTPTATPVINWSRRSIVDSSSNRPGPFLSAAIDANGKYYVAYFQNSSDQLVLVEGDGQTWTPLNLRQINIEARTVGLYVTLDINKDNYPYLSYLIWSKGTKKGPGRAGFLTSNGRWSLTTVGQNLDIYDMRSILDSTDIPHHAVLTKSGDVLYGSNGTTLEEVASEAFPSASIIQNDYLPLALAIDALGQPNICFSISGEMQCRHRRMEVWESTNVPGNGIYPSLQVDDAGNLHLAFYDSKAKVLKYAFLSNRSSSWTVETVDSTPNTGLYPSLILDSNGLVHISYYDEGNSALKYATGQFGEWHTYQVDNDGNVGLISSLIIDLQNNPAIAYYDPDRRQIYFIVGQ